MGKRIGIVTYFNAYYLRKAILMYLSLRRYINQQAEFYFYCYDWESVGILKALALPCINIIHISIVENWCRVLRDHFPERTLVEYMFTMTPYVLRHAYSLERNTRIIYVDSDYYFYSSPVEIIKKTEEYDLSFVEHGFPPEYQYLSVHGKYNVGWNSFRRTRSSETALNHWCRLTAEWCFDRVEDGKYADQKYLEILASTSGSFYAIDSSVMGLAEYNFFQHEISVLEETKEEKLPRILSNNRPVISWHHHGVLEMENGGFLLRINIDEARNSALYHRIYSYYTSKLNLLGRALSSLGLNPGYGNARSL